MKIITAKQQGEARIRLANLIDALMSNDAIKRMDAMEHIAGLAYIIGGLRLMNMVKVESFGEDGEVSDGRSCEGPDQEGNHSRDQ